MTRIHNTTAVLSVPTYVDEGPENGVSISVVSLSLTFADETSMQRWLHSLLYDEEGPKVAGPRTASFLVEDEDGDADELYLDKLEDRIDSKRIEDEHTKLSQELDREDREFAQRTKA
jgi:hypothetical protein